METLFNELWHLIIRKMTFSSLVAFSRCNKRALQSVEKVFELLHLNKNLLCREAFVMKYLYADLLNVKDIILRKFKMGKNGDPNKFLEIQYKDNRIICRGSKEIVLIYFKIVYKNEKIYGFTDMNERKLIQSIINAISKSDNLIFCNKHLIERNATFFCTPFNKLA